MVVAEPATEGLQIEGLVGVIGHRPVLKGLAKPVGEPIGRLPVKVSFNCLFKGFEGSLRFIILLLRICVQQIINNLFCPDFSFGAR